ncbi:MAG: dockerin type I domain-containing protein [Candidatus Moranbacteria bacterium]|nr:dockerin type I domain-containing protein [Candidatus Moranbacteria bacterium]
MNSKKTKTIIVVAILFFGMKISAAHAEDGLVAHWDFHEGSGVVLHDVSGNGNDGTIQGSIWESGPSGGSSLSFDGSNDYVEIPDSSSLDLSSSRSFAISTWAYVEDNSAQPGSVFDYLISKSGLSLHWRNDQKKLVFTVSYTEDGTTYKGGTTCDYALPTSQWSRIAMTLSPTRYIRLYVDGNIVCTGYIPRGSTFLTDSGRLVLGGLSPTDTTGKFFKGRLSGLKMYNRQLSDDEIRIDAGKESFKQKLKNLIFWTGNAHYQGMTYSELDKLDNSPFDVVTMPLFSGDTFRTADISSFQANIDAINRQTKEIWPKIWMSRLAGYCDESYDTTFSCGCKYTQPTNPISEFDKYIAGNSYYALDAGDQALEDFLKMYSLGLNLSKSTGASGISVDPETYGQDCAYSVGYIGSKKGISKDEVISKLSNIGSRMADITNDILPNAKILFAFSKLDNTNLSYANIIKGMLQRASEKGYTFTIIDGGEQVHYYHPSLFSLDYQLAERDKAVASYLSQYPNYELGATHSLALSTGYTSSDYVYPIEVYTLEDFRPLIKRLFDNYEYVWIYDWDRYNDFIPSSDQAKFPTSDMVQYRTLMQSMFCGNDVCDSSRGETEASCAVDCSAGTFSAGDLNQDYKINSTDLDILKSDFLKLAAALTNSRSDINSDGQCTVRDLGILMSNFGK